MDLYFQRASLDALDTRESLSLERRQTLDLAHQAQLAACSYFGFDPNEVIHNQHLRRRKSLASLRPFELHLHHHYHHVGDQAGGQLLSTQAKYASSRFEGAVYGSQCVDKRNSISRLCCQDGDKMVIQQNPIRVKDPWNASSAIDPQKTVFHDLVPISYFPAKHTSCLPTMQDYNNLSLEFHRKDGKNKIDNAFRNNINNGLKSEDRFQDLQKGVIQSPSKVDINLWTKPSLVEDVECSNLYQDAARCVNMTSQRLQRAMLNEDTHDATEFTIPMVERKLCGDGNNLQSRDISKHKDQDIGPNVFIPDPRSSAGLCSQKASTPQDKTESKNIKSVGQNVHQITLQKDSEFNRLRQIHDRELLETEEKFKALSLQIIPRRELQKAYLNNEPHLKINRVARAVLRPGPDAILSDGAIYDSDNTLKVLQQIILVMLKERNRFHDIILCELEKGATDKSKLLQLFLHEKECHEKTKATFEEIRMCSKNSLSTHDKAGHARKLNLVKHLRTCQDDMENAQGSSSYASIQDFIRGAVEAAHDFLDIQSEVLARFAEKLDKGSLRDLSELMRTTKSRHEGCQKRVNKVLEDFSMFEDEFNEKEKHPSRAEVYERTKVPQDDNFSERERDYFVVDEKLIQNESPICTSFSAPYSVELDTGLDQGRLVERHTQAPSTVCASEHQPQIKVENDFVVKDGGATKFMEWPLDRRSPMKPCFEISEGKLIDNYKTKTKEQLTRFQEEQKVLWESIKSAVVRLETRLSILEDKKSELEKALHRSCPLVFHERGTKALDEPHCFIQDSSRSINQEFPAGYSTVYLSPIFEVLEEQVDHTSEAKGNLDFGHADIKERCHPFATSGFLGTMNKDLEQEVGYEDKHVPISMDASTSLCCEEHNNTGKAQSQFCCSAQMAMPENVPNKDIVKGDMQALKDTIWKLYAICGEQVVKSKFSDGRNISHNQKEHLRGMLQKHDELREMSSQSDSCKQDNVERCSGNDLELAFTIAFCEYEKVKTSFEAEKTRNADYQRNNTFLQQRVEHCENHLTELLRAHVKEIKQKERTLSCVQELNTQLVQEMSKTEATLASLQTEHRDLCSILETKWQEPRIEVSSLKKLQQDLLRSEAKATDLEQSFEMKSTEVRDLETKIRVLQNEADEMLLKKHEFDETKKQRDEHQQQVHELININQELLSFSQNKEKEVISLKKQETELKQVIGKKIEERHTLEHALANKNNEIDLLRRERDSLKLNKDSLQSQLKDTESRLMQQEQVLNRFNSYFTLKESDQLYMFIKDAERSKDNELRQSRLVVQELEEKLARMENEICRGRTELADMIRVIEGKDEEASALKREAGDMQRRLQDLEEEIMEKDGQIAILKGSFPGTEETDY